MRRALFAVALLAISPAQAQSLDIVSHRTGDEVELQARLMQLGYQALLGKMQADVAAAQTLAKAKADDAKAADAPVH